MATLLPNGKQQFSSAAGPMVGGKVYTYDAGTLVPRATYTDAAGTVPNTNPIILDARGEATVFWSGSYKVVLKDALGNTIWTIDNVTDGSSAFSAGTGASLIGFIAAQVGAVARTALSKMREVVSIQDFPGCDPTGVTSSDGAEALAIAAFPAGQGTIYYPPGTYKIVTGCTVAQNGIHMVGAGRKVTTKVFAPTVAGTCVRFSKGAAVVYDCGLRDMSFAGTTAFKKTAIQLSDISSFTLRNIEVRNWTGAGSVGLQTLGREVSVFDNIYISADQPIQLSNNPNYTIDSNEFTFRDIYLIAMDATRACILADDGVFFSGTTFEGFQSWVHGKYGFYWANTTDPSASEKLVFRNIWREQSDDPTGWVFYIANTAGNVQDLMFDNCHGDILTNGYYLRGIQNANWTGGVYPGAAGKIALDVDASVTNMSMLGFHAKNGTVANLVNQRMMSALAKYDAGSPFADTGTFQSLTSMGQSQTNFGPIKVSTTGTAIHVAGADGQRFLYATETTNNVEFIGAISGGAATLGTVSNHVMRLAVNNTAKWELQTGGALAPFIDNDVALGDGARRPTVIYAVSGAINTSDRTEKANFRSIEAAVKRAVLAVPLRAFQWNDAIAKKGASNARWHYGPVAQDVRDAIAAEGVDPLHCAFVCFDKWDNQFEDVLDNVEEIVPALNTAGGLIKDEKGKTVYETRRVLRKVGERLRVPAGERWGLRMDQFLMVRSAALEDKLASLEARLATLEAK